MCPLSDMGRVKGREEGDREVTETRRKGAGGVLNFHFVIGVQGRKNGQARKIGLKELIFGKK